MELSTSAAKAGLLESIEAYGASGNEEAYSSILEKYYTPVQAALRERLAANQILLKGYPFYYADGEPLPEVCPLWQDEQEIIYSTPERRGVYRLPRWRTDRASLKAGIPLAVEAQMWVEDLTDCERRTAPESVFMDAYTPLYLIYEPWEWSLLMQLFDLKTLTDSGRVVFLVGMESVRKYFSGDGVIFPRKFIGTGRQSAHLLIQDSYQNKVRQMEENISETARYYSGRKTDIDRHFREGKPRILFITSRFTTALQYHTRDSMQAAQKLGCETMLLIEPDGLHRLDNAWEAKVVASFKPDAVYMLDHFRYERNPKIYPEEIIFITWIQDPMPHIMNPSTPSKLHARDFIMNHFIAWKAVLNTGYNREQVIDAPVPSNPSVYHPYALSEEEMRRYEADLCLVCHASDVDIYIQEILDQFNGNEPVQSILVELYRKYHRLAYSKEVIYHNEESFGNYIEKYFQKEHNIKIPKDIKDMIAQHMYVRFSQAVFRQALADWLIDAGFTRIKLWGNGWLKYEKYKNYAMGPAENGETLSKICQASKIVLGNNVNVTGAARAWETMLSGGFYMSNYIPAESDIVDIRKIMTPGENLVMFYNRKDLIKKVKYYLTHDEERREMARRGREAALQKMTYDALMKRVIQFIGDKVSSV